MCVVPLCHRSHGPKRQRPSPAVVRCSTTSLSGEAPGCQPGLRMVDDIQQSTFPCVPYLYLQAGGKGQELGRQAGLEQRVTPRPGAHLCEGLRGRVKERRPLQRHCDAHRRTCRQSPATQKTVQSDPS